MVCVVAILQALGRRLPVPMALLQLACGVALSSVASLDDLREQSALLFVMLVPPLLYIEAWQVPKRELLRSIGPVFGLAVGLVAVTIAVLGFGCTRCCPRCPGGGFRAGGRAGVDRHRGGQQFRRQDAAAAPVAGSAQRRKPAQ